MLRRVACQRSRVRGPAMGCRIVSLLLVTLIFLSVAGCSMIGEQGPGPKIVDYQPQFGGCDFPDKNKFENIKGLTADTLHQTFDCAREKLDSAFAQVKGNLPGEISVTEL